MNIKPLEGSTALVTGGAVRIGAAISRLLAENGAGVIIHYNTSSDDAIRLVSELQDQNLGAWCIQSDLGNRDEVESLLARAEKLAGRINILINNASIFPSDTPENLTLESLNRSLLVNAWAPYEFMRQFSKLLPHESRGSVVNILDSRTSLSDRSHAGYIISKQVLREFTKIAALEFAPGIRVNAVAPGAILPPSGFGGHYMANLARKLPLKKTGSAKDIADAVVFLVNSDFITGQVLYVDGGRHLMEA